MSPDQTATKSVWGDTESLRNAFVLEGFVAIPAVFSPDEITSLLECFAEAHVQRSKAGARHLMSQEWVAKLARGPRLVAIARELLGARAFPFRATLFDKSAESNWLVVWHQDTALPLRERRQSPGWGPWSVKGGILYAHAPASALSQVLALRVHLDDSTPLNGPLRVLPGTHCMGVLSDDAIHRFAQDIEAVECFLPRGGVLAMSPLLVHASSKLKGGGPRRVLHIEYAASLNLEEGLELVVA